MLFENVSSGIPTNTFGGIQLGMSVSCKTVVVVNVIIIAVAVVFVVVVVAAVVVSFLIYV